jgi:hypothetical protein
MLDELVSVLSIMLAGVFLASVVHKIGLVARGGRDVPPVLTAIEPGARHPRAALTLAAIVEGVAVCLLLVAPIAGLPLTVTVVALYTAALGRADARSPCRCFGPLSRGTSVADARRRNAWILALAALAFLGIYTGAASPAAVGAQTISLAALVASAPAALLAVNRATRRRVDREGARQW